MEQHSTAQDVHRCDLCETIVHSYCDFCHVNLCKPCIGEHISDGYDKHKIVPFKDRRSTLIYPKCKAHDHKNCKFQCKDCDIFVCSSCMASEQHRGHIFTEVLVVYKEKKTILENDIKKLENLISHTSKSSFDLEMQLPTLEGIYEELTAVITSHGEQWHKEIDIIINKMKTEIRMTKERHKDVLQAYLEKIKQKQESNKKDLLELRKITKSNEVSQTIEYSSKIKIFRWRPPKVEVKLPKFKSKPIDSDRLLTLFGQIIPLSNRTRESVFSLYSFYSRR